MNMFIRKRAGVLGRAPIGGALGAILLASAISANAAEQPRRAKSVADFLGPDGRLNVEEIRRSRYEGPLNLDGLRLEVDRSTGALAVQSNVSSPVSHPDDVYWDNSISPSVPGVTYEVSALAVYDDKLILGGYFTAAGHAVARNIASWDGTTWSPLGSGTNSSVMALTVYNGTLVAGGQFTQAGGKLAAYLAQWTKPGCPIVMTGDVNLSGAITSADIITLVNYVFKSGAPPQPCPAAGDVNCNGAVTSADVIGLVNFVFKSGAPPCDGCVSPLAQSCP